MRKRWKTRLCWPELEICGGKRGHQNKRFLLARELKRLRRKNDTLTKLDFPELKPNDKSGPTLVEVVGLKACVVVVVPGLTC